MSTRRDEPFLENNSRHTRSGNSRPRVALNRGRSATSGDQVYSKAWVSIYSSGPDGSEVPLGSSRSHRSQSHDGQRSARRRFSFESKIEDGDASTDYDTDTDQEPDMLDDVADAAPLIGNNHVDEGGSGDDSDSDEVSVLGDEEMGVDDHDHGHDHGHAKKGRRHYLNRIGDTVETHDPPNFDSAVEILAEVQRKSVQYTCQRCSRWALLFLVAIGVGVSAFIITWLTRILNYVRLELVLQPLAAAQELFFAYLSYTAVTCLFGLGAVMCVALGAVEASGSGIPEIMTILNGVKVVKAMRAMTWLMKVIGVSLSGAAGLPIGREGPMIHSGAIVGAVVSQGKTERLNPFYKKYLTAFRNDKTMREFITCGAAGGVAAAFGAPIGGVLFVLEEGCSWWYSSLTYRTVLVSVAALLFSTLFNTGINDAGFPTPGDFGDFFDDPGIFYVENKTLVDSQSLYYRTWELPIFACMGIAGGVCGGIFNFANEALFRWRKRRIFESRFHKARRIAEGVVVTFIVTTVSFGFSLVGISGCKFIPPLINETMPTALHQFSCPDGQYNEWASLFLTPLETGIKLLLYFEENTNYATYNATDGDKYFAPGSHSFSPILLAVFGTVFYALTCLTAGLSVPSSPFIPSLFAGAAYGRLVGQWIASLVGNMGYVNPGVYALVGAASLLGGVVRMVFCLAVIMIETTNFYQGIVPILIALLACRWAGNHFNDSLYHIYMHINHSEMLDWNPPKWYNRLLASHVMAKPVVNLRTCERAGRLLDLLRSTSFNGFPVVEYKSYSSRVDDGDEAAGGGDKQHGGRKRRKVLGRGEVTGVLRGIILRKQLLKLLSDQLKDRVLRQRRPPTAALDRPSIFEAAIADNAIPLQVFEEKYPKYPKVDDLELSAHERRMWIDLRPYMGIPHTVQTYSSLPRTYHIFRSLGLRHLVVVNDNYEVAGMITRTRLVPHHVQRIHRRFERMMESIRGSSRPKSYTSAMGGAFSNLFNRKKRRKKKQRKKASSHTTLRGSKSTSTDGNIN